MKNSSFLIGLLSVTAAILATLLILAPASVPQARADQISTSGDYTMISAGLVPNTSDEFFTVIDNRAGRMITYQFNVVGLNSGKLGVVGTFDLIRAFTGK